MRKYSLAGGIFYYMSRAGGSVLPVLAFIGAPLLVASWFAVLLGFTKGITPAHATTART
jgi:hypothetical protein